MFNLATVIDTAQSLGAIESDIPSIFGWEDQLRFLGIKLINSSDFFDLFIRLSINTILLFFIVHVVYSKNSKRKDFYFSFLGIGVIVFLICFLLSNVKLELGFALGLFAIFGILRYRTDAMPIKEMTYLFIVIGISVINALSNKKVSYAELILANGFIIMGLWILENKLMLKQELSAKLIYEKIENIHQMSEDVLLEDIKVRTGIDISRFEIVKIDFMKDCAEIILYYPAKTSKQL